MYVEKCGVYQLLCTCTAAPCSLLVTVTTVMVSFSSTNCSLVCKSSYRWPLEVHLQCWWEARELAAAASWLCDLWWEERKVGREGGGKERKKGRKGVGKR